MQLHSLANILQKRMDRKEFLRTLAIAALALVGLGFLLRQPRAAAESGAVQAPHHTNDTYGTKQ